MAGAQAYQGRDNDNVYGKNKSRLFCQPAFTLILFTLVREIV